MKANEIIGYIFWLIAALCVGGAVYLAWGVFATLLYSGVVSIFIGSAFLGNGGKKN